MLCQPAQRHISVGCRASVQDAVVKAHLGVVLAVDIAFLGVARRDEHAHGGYLVAHQGEVLAAAAGLAAILRVFLLDSIALESLDKIPPNLPDCLDLLPGTMPKILRRVCATAKVPVLAGGLIADKEDVMAALEAGITAISTTNQAVWDM